MTNPADAISLKDDIQSTIYNLQSTMRVVVMLSGSGSNLQALLDAQAAGVLGAQVALVLADRADAYGLQRALQHGIPAAFVPLPRAAGAPAERAALRAAWEQRLLA